MSSVVTIIVTSAADFREVIATTKQNTIRLHLKLHAAKDRPLIQMNDTIWG